MATEKMLDMDTTMTPHEVAEKISKLPNQVQQRILFLIEDAQLLAAADRRSA